MMQWEYVYVCLICVCTRAHVHMCWYVLVRECMCCQLTHWITNAIRTLLPLKRTSPPPEVHLRGHFVSHVGYAQGGVEGLHVVVRE